MAVHMGVVFLDGPFFWVPAAVEQAIVLACLVGLASTADGGGGAGR